jgi:hypothetical protein
MKTINLKNMIKNTMKSSKNDLAKKIEIMAIVTEALKSINVRPVIVGGQAVEFYTSGGYATMDVDMLCETSISEINSVLIPLGFKREGKYWILEDGDLNIAIEVPSGPLAGDWDKITKVETKQGLNAYFIGIEDIIIDRLNRYKHWREYSDEEWIIGMIILHYEKIDWEYIYKKAEEEKTLEEIKQMRKKAEQDINDM